MNALGCAYGRAKSLLKLLRGKMVNTHGWNRLAASGPWAIYHLPYKHSHPSSVFNEDIWLWRPGGIGLLLGGDAQGNGNGRLAKRTWAGLHVARHWSGQPHFHLCSTEKEITFSVFTANLNFKSYPYVNFFDLLYSTNINMPPWDNVSSFKNGWRWNDDYF